MEDLDSVLNSQKTLDLFEDDELGSVALQIRSFAEPSGSVDDRQSLLALFQKVRSCGFASANYHLP